MVPTLAKVVPCYEDLSSFEFKSPNGEFVISRGDEKKREVVNVVDGTGKVIGQAVENGMTSKERNCKLMCSGEFTEYPYELRDGDGTASAQTPIPGPQANPVCAVHAWRPDLLGTLRQCARFETSLLPPSSKALAWGQGCACERPLFQRRHGNYSQTCLLLLHHLPDCRPC